MNQQPESENDSTPEFERLTDTGFKNSPMPDSGATLTFLLTLSDALRNAADPQIIEQIVTEMTMQHFDADRCYYCEIVDDVATIRIEAQRGTLPGVAGTYHLNTLPLFNAALKTGEPFVVSNVQTSTLIDNTLKDICRLAQVNSFINTPVIKHGKPVGLLSITSRNLRDWDEVDTKLSIDVAERTWEAVQRVRAEQNLRNSEEKYRTLFNSLDEGVVSAEVLFDDNGNATDLRYLEHNPALTRQTGMPAEIAGKLVSQVFPRLESYWLQTYAQVVKTGKPERHEYYINAIDAWFNVYISRVGGKGSKVVVCVYNNITARKRSDAAMYDQEQRQQYLLKLSDGLRAITDAMEVRKVALKTLAEHLDLDRALFAEINEAENTYTIHVNYVRNGSEPHLGTFPIAPFDHTDGYVKSGHTGQVSDVETDPRLTQEEKNIFAQMRVRAYVVVPLLLNGKWICNLVAQQGTPRKWTSQEILIMQETVDRTWDAVQRAQVQGVLKNAEAAYLTRLEAEVKDRTTKLLESSDLLQATLDSSMQMIQVFKALRNKNGQIIDFIWLLNNHASEQVYGDVIGKRLLQNNPGVVAEGIFDTFVNVTETGIPQNNEVHYVHEQFDGWFYQSVVKMDDGVATSTADITERKRAEETIRKMESEKQLDIFRATLSTQEEERRRISESLHNGLGQLLYGIKISLNHLTCESAVESADKFNNDRRYTDQLLSQAIRESRRISHELMPAMLEDFGLQPAVEDICKQFSDGVQFTCSFKGLNGRLHKYVELAAFRIVQELMTNVIKHAKATVASTELSYQNGMIHIKVSDNGVGLKEDSDHGPGIGLYSIRNKVNLLNGEMKITSVNAGGTIADIRFSADKLSSAMPENVPNALNTGFKTGI